MTPPTGYCHAIYAGSGAVKVPDITTPHFDHNGHSLVIPGGVLGPGDIHIVSEGEAWESPNWTPCNAGGTPLPESANPLTKSHVEPEPDNADADDDKKKGGDR